jgi:two-component system alkaline phosphatase synthesis response regulator PhoP
VLIVDDDPELRDMLSFSLRLEGHQVMTAVHGRDALAQLPHVRPGVILLDLMMPVMDGAEFCRQIRQDVRFAATPIVCISAKHSAEREAGVLGIPCITKPFEIDEVTRTVRRLAGE